MADEKKDKAEGKKKSGKLMLFVIIGVVVVVAGGAGAGAMMFLGGGSDAQAATANGETAPPPPKVTESILSFDTFIVNLADQGKDRFMKATIRAVVTDPDLEGMVNADPLMKARIRDRIISILSSRAFSDVNSQMGKESLRREIAVELNQLFPEDPVKEILFAEFVVQ